MIYIVNSRLQQAEALAEDLAKTRLSIIYCSDLVRARRTAEAVKKRQLQAYPAHPSPSTSSSTQTRTALVFQESALLREQNFGVGEGMKFTKKEPDLSLEAHFAKGKFPALYTRQQCFPGGESLDAVAARAEDVFRQLLEPHIRDNGNQNKVVAVVSHGLFLAELIAVIVKKDTEFKGDFDVKNLRSMRNTAWTKLDVKCKVRFCCVFYSYERTLTLINVPVGARSDGSLCKCSEHSRLGHQQTHTFVQPREYFDTTDPPIIARYSASIDKGAALAAQQMTLSSKILGLF